MKPSAILLLLLTLLVACNTVKEGQDDPATPVIDESVQTPDGQPEFTYFDQYWIIDNDCGFDQELLEDSHEALQQLKDDGIAEVAIICQADITGGPSEALWWTMQWLNWARLGNEAGRGLVWLIRPDAPIEDHRIVAQNSIWLYQNTAIDYAPIVEEAAKYANVGDFNGTLEAIVRGTVDTLRRVVEVNP